MPESFRWLLYANPVSFPVEQLRRITFWGELPDWQGLLIYGLLSCAVALLGLAWFSRTRKGFADVL